MSPLPAAPRRSWRLLPLLAVLGLSVPAAAAAPRGAPDAIRFEITPYYGYRFGGEFGDVDFAGVSSLEIQDGSAYGLILSFYVHPNGQVELQYSQQRTELQGSGSFFLSSGDKLFDLNVETWQVGGNFTAGAPNDPVRGFLGFSLGLTNFEPQASGFEGDSQFAFSFYAGAKVALAKHFGLRFQGQWVATYVDSNDEVFCDPFGFCFVVSDADYLNQVELSAGLTFKF